MRTGLTVCGAIVLMLGFLGGCVSTTESTFQVAQDEEKAEEAYVRLGLAYIQEERFDRARRHLNRALDINSDSAPAKGAMGLLNQAEGEYELAEERFEEALRMDSEFTRGRSYYGVFLYNQGRYEESLEQFRTASEDTEYDNRAGVFVNRGRAATAVDEHEEAAESYQRAMRLERNNRRALEGALESLVELDRYDEARPLFERFSHAVNSADDVTHSPRTLLAGIKLARHDGDADQEASLALQLRQRFPDSEQHRRYRAMSADE